MPRCSECQSHHEEQYLATCDDCESLFCLWCSEGQTICPTCIRYIAEDEEDDLIDPLPELIEG